MAGLMVAVHAAAQQPATGPATVSLDEAVRRSLQVQPAMVQALGNQRNADATKLQTVGTFLPSVSAGWNASKSSQARFDQNRAVSLPPIWNYGYNVSASVDLFDGFRRLTNLKAASADQTAADAGYVNQRFATELATKEAYFAELANEDLVRVAQSQVVRTQQELKAATDKVRVGAATRADSLTAAVDLGNAQVTLLQAQANLIGAQAALGRQIGVRGLVRAAPDSTLPAFPDTTALLAIALENAPQVVAADAQATAARASLWSARSQYLPTFNVSYGNNRSDTTFAGGFDRGLTTSWRFGASWTLFNGFAREQSTVSASVVRDVAIATAADTRLSVSAQLTQQVAALSAAHLQIQIAQANVVSATEALRVQQQKYQVGTGLLLDLLTSEANLTQAEVSLIQAQFTYRTTRATIESLIGKDL